MTTDGRGDYVLVIDPLGENERKDITLDFTEELSDCDGSLVDTLSTAEWTVEPDGLTIDGQGILNNIQAAMFVSTPTPATFYRVVCYAQTVGGRRYEKAVGVPGQKIDGTK